jgi:hypothetical protein
VQASRGVSTDSSSLKHRALPLALCRCGCALGLCWCVHNPAPCLRAWRACRLRGDAAAACLQREIGGAGCRRAGRPGCERPQACPPAVTVGLHGLIPGSCIRPWRPHGALGRRATAAESLAAAVRGAGAPAAPAIARVRTVCRRGVSTGPHGVEMCAALASVVAQCSDARGYCGHRVSRRLPRSSFPHANCLTKGAVRRVSSVRALPRAPPPQLPPASSSHAPASSSRARQRLEHCRPPCAADALLTQTVRRRVLDVGCSASVGKRSHQLLAHRLPLPSSRAAVQPSVPNTAISAAVRGLQLLTAAPALAPCRTASHSAPQWIRPTEGKPGRTLGLGGTANGTFGGAVLGGLGLRGLSTKLAPAEGFGSSPGNLL